MSVFSLFSILDGEGNPRYFSITSNTVTKRLHDLINASANPKSGRQYTQAVSVWLRSMKDQGIVPAYKLHGMFDTLEEAQDEKRVLMAAVSSTLVNKNNNTTKFKKAVS